MTWIDDHLSTIHADDAEVLNVQRFCIQQSSSDLVWLAKKIVEEEPCPMIRGIIEYYYRRSSLSPKQRKCLALYIAKRFYLLNADELGQN